MSKAIKFADIVSIMNNAPSGGFVGITDYESEKGEVSSVVGHLNYSYEKAKQKKIKALKEAIEKSDFEEITISGQCRNDGTCWNSRKSSAPLKKYNITYSKNEVIEVAKKLLEGWETPSNRQNNKVILSDKGGEGLTYNTETGNITFTLLVETQTYKSEKSQALKESKGIEAKPENKMPEVKLKEKLTKRFEKKVKAFTLAQGKFAEISINGERFTSNQISF